MVMKSVLKIVLLGCAVLVLAVLAIVGFNYFKTGLNQRIVSKPAQQVLGNNIRVFDWNLGYAGLGEASDFIEDGGVNFFPPSRAVVQANVEGIKKTLAAYPSDVYLIQEISKPDMMTLGVDVYSQIRDGFSNHSHIYTTDIATRFIPRQYGMHHGLATFYGFEAQTPTTIRLPNEPTRYNGILKRQYHMQMTEFKTGNGANWAVFNIHLSAYDEGGNIRKQQYEKLLKIVDGFYQQGKHVIVGGDWNMQMEKTTFPYTTDDKHLDWVKLMPKEKLPNGWSMVYDPKFPSARNNGQPYIKGENYTTIIDGYLISPNVEDISVQTLDENFKYSDHQPVLAEFTSRSLTPLSE